MKLTDYEIALAMAVVNDKICYYKTRKPDLTIIPELEKLCEKLKALLMGGEPEEEIK